MVIAKVPAVIAAVLFMSSVSAQAMEFADRPGVTLDIVGSLPAFHFILNDDYSRRQINNLNILLHPTVAQTRLAERPKPISNVIPTKLSQSGNRPGRLSAEFSADARGYSMNFEFGPGELSSWLKPTGTRIVMTFPHHPGPIGTLFPPVGAENIQLADRTFASSIAKPIIRPGMRSRQSSAVTCVGSMAPCGSLSFVQPSRMGSLSATYSDEGL